MADEASVRLTAEWLEKAAEGYRAAELLLASRLIMPALFHCQQAAEKALKAVLCFQGRPIEKTHDLVRLDALASQGEASWTPLVEHAALLTPLAVSYRYPGEDDLPDGEEALAACRAILAAIRAHLPEALLPSAWPCD